MGIKIIIPAMEPNVQKTFMREIEAHLPLLGTFAAPGRTYPYQKIEFITLYSYAVERMPEHDVILTFPDVKSASKYCAFRGERKADLESMVEDNVNSLEYRAYYMPEDKCLHACVLRGICKHYGIAVPNGYMFRDWLGRLSYRSPIA